MASDVPEGFSIEPIFVIEAAYAPDAAERRPAYRAEHLARLAALRDSGVVVEAGAFADLSGALILVRAGDEATVRELAVSDVYMRSGIWVDFRIRPFGRVRRSAEIAGQGSGAVPGAS